MNHKELIESVTTVNSKEAVKAAHAMLEACGKDIMPLGVRVVANIDNGNGIETVMGITVAVLPPEETEPCRCAIQTIDGSGLQIICKAYNSHGGPIEPNTFSIHPLDAMAFIAIAKGYQKWLEEVVIEDDEKPDNDASPDTETDADDASDEEVVIAQ